MAVVTLRIQGDLPPFDDMVDTDPMTLVVKRSDGTSQSFQVSTCNDHAFRNVMGTININPPADG